MFVVTGWYSGFKVIQRTPQPSTSSSSAASLFYVNRYRYIAAKAGKIASSLSEICLERNMAAATLQFLRLATPIDKCYISHASKYHSGPYLQVDLKLCDGIP